MTEAPTETTATTAPFVTLYLPVKHSGDDVTLTPLSAPTPDETAANLTALQVLADDVKEALKSGNQNTWFSTFMIAYEAAVSLPTAAAITAIWEIAFGSFGLRYVNTFGYNLTVMPIQVPTTPQPTGADVLYEDRDLRLERRRQGNVSLTLPPMNG